MNANSVEHQGPPLMLNKAFFEHKENIFKVLQILFGIATLVFNNVCYPNIYYDYCRAETISTLQVFSIIVINVFCIIITAALALANLLGFYDTFYKYDWRYLEKNLAAFFAIIYLLDFIGIAAEAFSHLSTVLFLLPALFTLITGLLYAYDYRQLSKKYAELGY